MTNARDISIARAARALVYMALSFFIVYAINGGKLGSIVHPRMTPWIVAAGLLFLALSFVETLRLDKSPRRPDPISYYYPILFVLAIAYLFTQSGGLATGSYSASPESTAFQSALISQKLAKDKKNEAEEAKPLPAHIVFYDDSYWSLYNRLYDDPAAAAGKSITIQGFLTKEKGLPAGTLLVARNLMWCCSADMAVIGLPARGGGIEAVSRNAWVEVTGRLSTARLVTGADGKATTAPLIEVESVRPIERSASTTIFPF